MSKRAKKTALAPVPEVAAPPPVAAPVEVKRVAAPVVAATPAPRAHRARRPNGTGWNKYMSDYLKKNKDVPFGTAVKQASASYRAGRT